VDLQEIEILLEPNGQVRIQVRGVKGPSCLELTADLETALGGQVVSRQMTAEAYEPARQDVPLRQQQQGG
jgi:hypothetical protein